MLRAICLTACFIGHRHRDQDRGLGREAEGGQGLVRVPLARGGEPHLAFSLSRRHPAPEPVEVEPGGLLVGGDHEQLAQTARALARRQAPLGPAFARSSRVALNACCSSSRAKPVRSAVKRAGRVVSVGYGPERRCGPTRGCSAAVLPPSSQLASPSSAPKVTGSTAFSATACARE